ncbi:nucleoside-diphosphate sugar epimerase/dehydratase [Candidatus Hepatobacter penaei]|uniref:nucleoside-diphosphate sugar epimerase/dehydratase n=1 Tax=Candidatus Hepatobacter penaei TaxID=1274402 RepID=UPI0006966369|nr:nucleoside-diphosphate sugar epimerase/dehydratase [Candidatus Hepatobacter penaei]
MMMDTLFKIRLWIYTLFAKVTWFFARNPTVRAFVCDVGVAMLSLPLALVLRLGLQFSDYSLWCLFFQTLAFGGIATGTLLITGFSKGMWRYVSVADLFSMVKTTFLCEVLFVPYLLLSMQYHAFPLTALVIQGFLLGGGWLAVRLAARAFFAYKALQNQTSSTCLDALIVGVNDQSEQFLRQLLHHQQPLYRIVGFLEQESHNVSRYVHGVPVLGRFHDLDRLLGTLRKRKKNPKVLIVSHVLLSGYDVAFLSQKTQSLGLRMVHLPSPSAVGQLEKPSLGSLDFAELLKRPARATDHKNLQLLIQGKRVLITGAGGTIGRECTLQLASLFPSQLSFLDHNEYALYETTKLLRLKHPHVQHKPILLDVRNKKFVHDMVGEEKPDFVFHAAALKHVPVVENQPVEGVLTNVLGTRYLADACVAHQVRAMVLVSTDKAVMPKSLMGATKRLAELYCHHASTDPGESATKFLAVRFGNVLGSSGSVLPLFKEQVIKGGPVTVTHPEMTRYFMTISEAASLIIYALHLKMNTLVPKESTFMLDMGEPISILEMAETLIRLHGFVPGRDIKIEFTGLRPGEKLHEDLFFRGESARKTEHPHIALSTLSHQVPYHFLKKLEELEHFAWTNNSQGCLNILEELLPQMGKVANI